MATVTEWTLEQRFQAVSLLISKHHTFEQHLTDPELRKRFHDQVALNGRTLYTIQHASVLSQHAACDRYTLSFIAKREWEQEPQEVRDSFKEKTSDFCRGRKVVLGDDRSKLVIPGVGRQSCVLTRSQSKMHGYLTETVVEPQKKGPQYATEAVDLARVRTEKQKKTLDETVIIPKLNHVWSLAERLEALGFLFCGADGFSESAAQPDTWRLEGLDRFAKWLFAVGVVPEIYAGLEPGEIPEQETIRTAIENRWHGLLSWQKAAVMQESARVREAGFDEVLVCLRLDPSDYSSQREVTHSVHDNDGVVEKQMTDVETAQSPARDLDPPHDGQGPPLQHATLHFPNRAYLPPRFRTIDLEDVVDRYEPKKLLELSASFQHGRDLFDFHMYPIMWEHLGHNGDDERAEQLANHIWSGLSRDVKNRWSKGSQGLREKCQAGNPTSLFRLGTYGCLKEDEDYHFLAYSQIVPHADTAAGGITSTAQIELILGNVSESPLIMDALMYTCHPSVRGSQDRVEIYRYILEGFQWHLDRLRNNRAGWNIVLKGRTWDGLLINYDPSVDGRRGIKNRLMSLMSSSSSDWNIELLLRPLALWNLNAPFVPRDYAKGKLQLFTDSALAPKPNTELVWDKWPDLHKIIKAMARETRSKTIAKIINVVRRRCEKVHPQCLLLQPSVNHKTVHPWCLSSAKGGLVSRLLACFEGPERDSEDYEELIESCLYGLYKAHPSAVSGNFPAHEGCTAGDPAKQHRRDVP